MDCPHPSEGQISLDNSVPQELLSELTSSDPVIQGFLEQSSQSVKSDKLRDRIETLQKEEADIRARLRDREELRGRRIIMNDRRIKIKEEIIDARRKLHHYDPDFLEKVFTKKRTEEDFANPPPSNNVLALRDRKVDPLVELESPRALQSSLLDNSAGESGKITYNDIVADSTKWQCGNCKVVLPGGTKIESSQVHCNSHIASVGVIPSSYKRGPPAQPPGYCLEIRIIFCISGNLASCQVYRDLSLTIHRTMYEVEKPSSESSEEERHETIEVEDRTMTEEQQLLLEDLRRTENNIKIINWQGSLKEAQDKEDEPEQKKDFAEEAEDDQDDQIRENHYHNHILERKSQVKEAELKQKEALKTLKQETLNPYLIDHRNRLYQEASEAYIKALDELQEAMKHMQVLAREKQSKM
ncbi:hypothetical protein BDV96DRAFT_674801 [Lophiotrema nucula]|uniref:Uncharacterized protein n=1 Tax=Lophiotrema nucula TaxID=690887 RepID=A0A6A5YI90_9PLEO|nr:hypothetical protein BDV96DRAFT_674801 [Lophiotrema nucula]